MKVEGCAVGSVATGRASQAGQVSTQEPDEVRICYPISLPTPAYRRCLFRRPVDGPEKAAGLGEVNPKFKVAGSGLGGSSTSFIWKK